MARPRPSSPARRPELPAPARVPIHVTSRSPLLRPALVLAVLGAAGVAAAPATAAPGPTAPTVLSVEANDTPVDGWDGWLIWSRREADGRYALVARTPAGDGLRLPVIPQDAPIDASVGPGPTGTPTVVYAACAKTTSTVPTGCDVRRMDLTTGVDAAVPAASSPDVDERFPSIWGSRIAFSRARSAKRPARTGVAIADVDATAAVAPTVFGTTKEKVGRRRVASTSYGPQGIDLRESTLAITWRTAGRAPERWRLLVSRAGRTPRTVLTAISTRRTLSRLGAPSLSATAVVAPQQRAGSTSRSELVRTTLDGKRAWTLGSGFTDAQTERYGSALSAATWLNEDQLVVVRRLASDGRWSCKHPLLPDARGCELLSLQSSVQPWRRFRR